MKPDFSLSRLEVRIINDWLIPAMQNGFGLRSVLATLLVVPILVSATVQYLAWRIRR